MCAGVCRLECVSFTCHFSGEFLILGVCGGIVEAVGVCGLGFHFGFLRQHLSLSLELSKFRVGELANQDLPALPDQHSDPCLHCYSHSLCVSIVLFQ